MRAACTVALLTLLTSACSSVVPGRAIGHGAADFDFRNPPACNEEIAASADQVEIRYLAAGGVAVGWKNDIILVGPFFSNPSPPAALFRNVRWDDARIEEGLRPVDTTRVRAVLAGHSHYDHLGDLPKIAERLPSPATVYVNDAGRNLLHPYAKKLRIESFERQASPVEITPGIRFRAYSAGHAPQFCLFHSPLCFRYASADSVVPSDTPWEARRNRHLSGGLAHVFVIELMEGEKVRFRIYYNDAATSPADVHVPAGLDIDVAILCLPGWEYVDDYPHGAVAALRPRHVLVTHHENFFSKSRGRWHFVPLLTSRSVERFLGSVRDTMRPDTIAPVHRVCGPSTAAWTMPIPGAQVVFAAQ